MAMMGKRARSKGRRKSERLLGTGTVANEYAIAYIGPNPRRTTAYMVMVLAVVIALSFVIFGIVIIPGILLLGSIFEAIERPASVVVTNQGLAVFARSEFSGRPRKVLAVLPHGTLTSPTVLRSGAFVNLPEFHLWLHKKEYERLLKAGDGKLVTNAWDSPVPVGVGAKIPGPNPKAASITSTRSVAPIPPQGNIHQSPPFQPQSVGGVIYCSWCGKERAVNAPAIHHCGSKERPVVYCMGCGTPFGDNVTYCASCGIPVTQKS
jgi:hypothetical protein